MTFIKYLSPVLDSKRTDNKYKYILIMYVICNTKYTQKMCLSATLSMISENKFDKVYILKNLKFKISKKINNVAGNRFFFFY